VFLNVESFLLLLEVEGSHFCSWRLNMYWRLKGFFKYKMVVFFEKYNKKKSMHM